MHTQWRRFDCSWSGGLTPFVNPHWVDQFRRGHRRTSNADYLLTVCLCVTAHFYEVAIRLAGLYDYHFVFTVLVRRDITLTCGKKTPHVHKWCVNPHGLEAAAGTAMANDSIQVSYMKLSCKHGLNQFCFVVVVVCLSQSGSQPLIF